jgi:hypothetical protein
VTAREAPWSIQAPWSEDQVRNLNAFQRSGRMHPFTCGWRSEHGGEGILVATAAGWECPADGCEYRQTWALPFMAQPLPPLDPHDLMARAREENERGRQAVIAIARISSLHRPVQYMSVTICDHCSVQRSTGPRTWERIAIMPHPCQTIEAIEGEL